MIKQGCRQRPLPEDDHAVEATRHGEGRREDVEQAGGAECQGVDAAAVEVVIDHQGK